MRYYDLDTNGKVKGSYAVPQPGKTLHLLEDAPDEESQRDGVPGTVWMPDQDKVDKRLAQEAKQVKKEAAKASLKNTSMGSIVSVPQLREAVKSLLDAMEIEYTE